MNSHVMLKNVGIMIEHTILTFFVGKKNNKKTVDTRIYVKIVKLCKVTRDIQNWNEIGVVTDFEI